MNRRIFYELVAAGILGMSAIGAILAETRTRPHRTGALAAPLHKDEVQSSLRERPV